VVYPLLNPCHDIVGKTGLVMVAVQGAPSRDSFLIAVQLSVSDVAVSVGRARVRQPADLSLLLTRGPYGCQLGRP